MIKDYIIKERLGTGAFGIVYKVLKKSNNNIYVIKQIPLYGLTSQQVNEAKSEARILSSVRSCYIVRYYESFEEKNNLNIVMEYCDGGDLSEYINKNKKTRYLLREDIIWNIFLKITIGLATLHKANILHRDLKTLNIFMTKNLDIKIGDFGVAKILTKSGFAKTIIGTPYYLSPELCDEKPYNDKSDVWALGCILYELSTYRHPFNAKCQASLVLKILETQPAPIHKYYSQNLQKLINLILDKNYVRRPSCYDILNLPFVIEKAKALNLYDKIKTLYLIKNIIKRPVNNNINRSYILQEGKKNKVYEQNTAPSRQIKRKYNKINSSRYLKSEQNVKLNKNLNNNREKGLRNINKYNNHVLFVSKSNENFKRNQNNNEHQNKSCERNKNQVKERIKINHIINISNLDNNDKRNNANNINNSNRSNEKNINNDNKRYQNQGNKNIYIYKNNIVINSINEFEKKINNKCKNNIKKISIINNTKKEFNKDSNNLNIEEDFLKNIKISDILDNKDLDIMIQNKLAKGKDNKKLINMKEFANHLNSYVSKVSHTDINNKQNYKNININKKINNNKKTNLQINKENNNNINKIYKNNDKDKQFLLKKNYSVDVKLNKKSYEKIVVNNIYDCKENNNKNKVIAKDNIHSIYTNFNQNNKEEKYQSKNIKQTQSNKVLHNNNIFNQKENMKNRINSAIYNKNTEIIRKYPNKLDRQNISQYNNKYNTNSDNQSYSHQRIIKSNEKRYYGKGKTHIDIYDYD